MTADAANVATFTTTTDAATATVSTTIATTVTTDSAKFKMFAHSNSPMTGKQ
jgi:hypothetical protein